MWWPEKNNDSNNGRIGFGGALTLLFIGLKLGGVIDWGWGRVLAPLWVPILIAIPIIVIAYIKKW